MIIEVSENFFLSRDELDNLNKESLHLHPRAIFKPIAPECFTSSVKSFSDEP